MHDLLAVKQQCFTKAVKVESDLMSLLGEYIPKLRGRMVPLVTESQVLNSDLCMHFPDEFMDNQIHPSLVISRKCSAQDFITSLWHIYICTTEHEEENEGWQSTRVSHCQTHRSVETIVEDSETFISKWDKTISCRAWHPPSWSTRNQASKDTFPHFIITIINNWLIVSSVYGFLLLTNIVFMINNVYWWSGDSVIYCEPSWSVSLTG